MKAIVFFRKDGTPDSRIMENDLEHDDIVKRITLENEGANIIGIMDYEAANRWVLENMRAYDTYNTGNNADLEALKSAIIKLDVALIAFKQGDEKRGLKFHREARIVLDTIRILTGRKIDFSYNDIERTGYKLIENQYEKNEAVIYESK